MVNSGLRGHGRRQSECCIGNGGAFDVAAAHRLAATQHAPFCRQARTAIVSIATSASSGSGASAVGVFPAGGATARMTLPALLLRTDTASLLDPERAPVALAAIDDAVSAGATGILLEEGGLAAAAAAAAASGAGALYDAGLKLKAALRGRAALLLLDRLDVAAAVGADGVVLSPGGAHGYHHARIASGQGISQSCSCLLLWQSQAAWHTHARTP